jgi:hypothetical protein
MEFPPGKGCGGMQAEIYFSEKYRPLTESPDDWIEPAVDGLIKCGLIGSRREIIHQSAIMLPFGNIIFDLERKAAVDTVHGYRDEVGIRYCGRFDQWGYIWTDAAFMSGERGRTRCLGRGGTRGSLTKRRSIAGYWMSVSMNASTPAIVVTRCCRPTRTPDLPRLQLGIIDPCLLARGAAPIGHAFDPRFAAILTALNWMSGVPRFGA